jgi:anaphase-promoting complex subunit 3
MDEGVRGEPFDDSRPNTASTTGSMASNDQEDETMSIGGIAMSSQTITIGVSEILNLLRTLGEGCRLSYMYRCQEALDTYMKLPHKHYNTGWVLSQVTSDSFSFRLPYMDIA